MILVSSVTAPLRARALPPGFDAPVVRVILVRARILPANVLLVPSVAELPTCQYTLPVPPLLIRVTLDEEAVVSELPIWKSKRAWGSMGVAQSIKNECAR